MRGREPVWYRRLEAKSAGREIRVVHLITSLDIGGAETTLCRLATAMDRDRFDSRVISLLPPGPLAPGLARAGIPVSSLGVSRAWQGIPGLLALAARLRRLRPHILQTWLYHADLLGLLAGTLARCGVTAWNLRCADDAASTRSRRLTRWVCGRLAHRPAVVVVNSEAGRTYHRRLGYSPRRWLVIPNGVDTGVWKPCDATRAAVRRELGIAPGAIVIGLVANFDPVKDHRSFLRAAGALADATDVSFLLIGHGITGDNPVLMRSAAETGLGDRVRFLGPRSDLHRLTAALDIASLSSTSEGMPNVILEAMACGVPCVATDVGDVAAVIGDTGIVVAPRCPEALAAGWRRLLSLGPEGRRRLGEAARERIEHHYSLPAMVRRYEELYLDLAGAGAPCAG